MEIGNIVKFINNDDMIGESVNWSKLFQVDDETLIKLELNEKYRVIRIAIDVIKVESISNSDKKFSYWNLIKRFKLVENGQKTKD